MRVIKNGNTTIQPISKSGATMEVSIPYLD
jgi:hypothetical protein